MASDYRIAFSTVSSYTLNNTAAYLPENWTRPSDMQPGYVWSFTLAAPPIDGDKPVALDGIRRVQGGASFDLKFWLLTQGMLNQLKQTDFAGAESIASTIQIPHPDLGWTVYNGILQWTALDGETVHQHDTLYTNVIFSFTRATVAAYGRAHSSAFSSAHG